MDQIKDLVIQASTTLYATNDKEHRKTAEEWLNNFKKSAHAWYIADQILHTEKNEQVLFFAAQTIRSKIQNDFVELPLDSHESLKNSLLDHLEKLSSYNLPSVMTQIYISIADMVLLMPNWVNPLLDIMQKVNRFKLSSLIELLKILPEEINNKRLKLGLNRRDHVRTLFSEASEHMIQFLDTSLMDNLTHQANLKLVYKCFASWSEEKLFTSTQILHSKLYPQVFLLLNDTNIEHALHETLTTSLINLLIMFNNLIVADNDKLLLISLKENILKLGDVFNALTSTHQLEKSIDLCVLFTELCNSLSYYLINDPNTIFGDFNCLNLLLLCAFNDNYEVFQKSFIFWFNIAEDIYTHQNSQKICSNFHSYIMHLIECACKHCKLPIDHVGIPPSRLDDFGEFRTKVMDLVSDVIFIVQADYCFANLYTILQKSSSTWNEVEAALFLMSSIVKSISLDEQGSIPMVVQALIGLSEQVHIAVRYTGINLIGELCEWLDKNPQYIDGCLNFIFNGFSNVSLCQIAASTMQSICTKCNRHMINNLDTLVNIVTSPDAINIPSDAYVGLLKGVVVILCNLPNEQIAKRLLKLCEIQIEGLQRVLKNELSKDGIKGLPIYWLDKLTAIFRTIKLDPKNSEQSNPCLPAVEYMWPTLSICLTKYQKDFKVTESTCKTLRFALRCTESQSRTIIEPLVHTIVSLYQVNHHSSYLYLGSILVDIYGSEVMLKNGFVQMMQAFTQEAFNFIIQNCKSTENLSELRKYPDTIDDFFRLAMRFALRCPKEFLESPILVPIIDLAVNTLVLDHRDAHLSVTRFLSDFVALSNNGAVKGLQQQNQNILSEIVNQISPTLIRNLVNCVVNSTMRDSKDGLADLLFELIIFNKKYVEETLFKSLIELGKISRFGNEIVNESQLLDIHTKIMQAVSSNDIEIALDHLEQLFQ